jgi:hypothetical protein
VLDHSLEEIAALLGQSVPAIKAALYRGRTRLRALGATVGPPVPVRSVSPTVARYAALFNARDWDGVRAMLLDDVQLDLVSRAQRTAARSRSTSRSTPASAPGIWSRGGSMAAKCWPSSGVRGRHGPRTSSS